MSGKRRRVTAAAEPYVMHVRIEAGSLIIIDVPHTDDPAMRAQAAALADFIARAAGGVCRSHLVREDAGTGKELVKLHCRRYIEERQELDEERAAILEFDGNLPRREAEALAFRRRVH
jgi:hypothetical protein